MDLYMEAKIRQQQRIDEAKVWRLVKSAKAGRQSEREELGGQLMMWLRAHLMMLGAKPQTQWK